MHKHNIEVPAIESFARPRTRREILKLAAVGLGAAAGASLMPKAASAQTGNTDLDILNFALTIEYFESEVFYPAALNAGILSDNSAAVVGQIAEIEVVHRDALISAIESLGGVPVERPQFVVPDYVLADEATFLNTALQQEITDVGALLGAAPMIVSPDVLAAAGAIAGSEGENVVALRNLLGIVPPANEAFPAALTTDEVLAAVAPFMGMASMPATGGVEDNQGSARAV